MNEPSASQLLHKSGVTLSTWWGGGGQVEKAFCSFSQGPCSLNRVKEKRSLCWFHGNPFKGFSIVFLVF